MQRLTETDTGLTDDVILLLFHRSRGHSETLTGKDHGIHYASTIGLHSTNDSLWRRCLLVNVYLLTLNSFL